MERPVIRKSRYGLFIDCHEKVPQVERMCKSVNYEDMIFIVETRRDGKLTRFGLKFGNGLMGKNAEIRKVMSDTEWEEEEGILVIANINRHTVAHETCYIKNIKDKGDVINLGPADFLTADNYKGKKLNEIGVVLLGPNTPK
jgi:hypothetical protein